MKAIIEGGKTPQGTVNVSGAKNSATRLLAAACISDGEVILQNFPTQLVDAQHKIRFLQNIGAEIIVDDEAETLRINSKGITSTELDVYDYPIRTTYLLAAAQIKRSGSAKIPYPGGCKIGSRGYDLHIMVWESLGCKVTEEPDFIHIEGKSFIGGQIKFPISTVGGTENAHEMLIQKYPRLNSSDERFLCSDYIDLNNMDPIFEMINNFSPAEIYVCLGIRKQELIGKLLRQRFPHISIVGLGASIDFESGNIKRTSLLMQKFGLEWFFRMLKEPRMIPRNLRGIYALMYFFAAYILKKNNPFNEFNIK